MTKIIGIIVRRFNYLFNPVDIEVTPNSVNASYKLVIVDAKEQTCSIHYFFTITDAIKHASPPNIFLGNGYEYFIYHRLRNNQESFIKLNNLTKTNHYYGCNIKGSDTTGRRDPEALLPGTDEYQSKKQYS